MNHHGMRVVRLLAQRACCPGVLSSSNCGVAMHAMRVLGLLKVRDARFIEVFGELFHLADARSRANMFHAVAVSVREQESVHEGMSENLISFLQKMQESIFSDVDDLTPSETILVIEGLLKITPYRCAQRQLVLVLRGRVTSLGDVVSSPVELIGIVRVVVEAMQEPQLPSADTSLEEEDSCQVQLGRSKELRELCNIIECRLDSFGKQDLITLVDALTLRGSREESAATQGRPGEPPISFVNPKRSQGGSLRTVPDECWPLILKVMKRLRLMATLLSSSQVSAWLVRMVGLRLHHDAAFMGLLRCLTDDRVCRAMSLSQLSTCVESLSAVLRWSLVENDVSRSDQLFIAQIIVKMLDILVSRIANSGSSLGDCVAYVLPAISATTDGVAAGLVEMPQTLTERLFLIPLQHLDELTPRQRAELFTSAFIWGVPKCKQLSPQRGTTSGGARGRQDQCSSEPVFALTTWCSAISRYVHSYNLLDALQIINEVCALAYVEAKGRAPPYDTSLLNSTLLQLHGRVQGILGNLHEIPTPTLVRYLSSMSKLGIRRKADYYAVMGIVQRRDMTEFERLRVLGVVSRHRLRAQALLADTVSGLPQLSGSLQPQQKCLLLRYLGQAGVGRLVRAPLHSSLNLGALLTPEEVDNLSLIDAICAFVGLVDLRQFSNETLPALLHGPLLLKAESFVDVQSSALLGDFLAALCRVDNRLVLTKTLCDVLNMASKRLTSFGSFFVDAAEPTYWMRLLQDWPRLVISDDGRCGDNSSRAESDLTAYDEAYRQYVATASAIAATRLLDMAHCNTLQPNTFLFNQLAMGYRLGVSLSEEDGVRLSHNLDSKHLPRLMGNPRDIVNAAVTGLFVLPFNASAADQAFNFVAKSRGSLRVQDEVVLGVELAEFLRKANDKVESGAAAGVIELSDLVKKSLRSADRQKKLSVQELAFAASYGLVTP
uniref:Uncharacterized protein TCIL3000_11_15800 n=1 Tax=Trypanosoma congolense (strain IL3000) TaxID=1068625 RepID=G0V347_TRYCI|nr:unnamed protein product [Trypanosoma congolense IL3000]